MADYDIFATGYDKSLDRSLSVESGSEAPAQPVLNDTATAGEYTGGFTPNLVEQSKSPQGITSGSFASVLFANKQTFTDSIAGYRMGIDALDGTYKWIIGDASSSADWNVTTPNTFTVNGNFSAIGGTIGGFTIGADYIRDAGNSFGLASTVTGGDDIRFWAGAPFANRASAPFSVTETGVVVMTSATVNGSAIANQDIFGSGEDGDVTLGGDTTNSKDMFYKNLTIPAGFTLNPGGFRVFVKETLTIEATAKIARNGNNGSGGVAGVGHAVPGTGGAGGAALASGSIYGSESGKAGGTGGSGGVGAGGASGTVGTAGTAITNSFATSFASLSGAGGSGGDGSGAFTPGAGAASGATGSISTSTIRPFTAIFGIEMFDKVAGSSPAFLKYNSNVGGAGGGGGGAAGAGVGANEAGAGGGGGGSGSTAGIIVLCARTIANAGSIQAIGGSGGAGGAGADAPGNSGTTNDGGGGGGGGGTGGPGGAIVLIYSTLTGLGTISAVGGSGGLGGAGGAKSASGAGGTNGVNGSNGSTGVTGKIIQLQV